MAKSNYEPIKGEIWCYDVECLHGKYAVSNFARIMNIKTQHIMAQRIYGRGYLYVELSFNGKNKLERVHRLVAFGFVPNDDPLKVEVNHIDGNKLNNKPDNLEWASHLVNVRHYYDTGFKGRTVSEETKKKLSQALKGRPLSEEHKRKISQSLKGKKYPNRKKTGPLTPEHRAKLSRAKRRRDYIKKYGTPPPFDL